VSLAGELEGGSGIERILPDTVMLLQGAFKEERGSRVGGRGVEFVGHGGRSVSVQ
jgi:hypothetical protein